MAKTGETCNVAGIYKCSTHEKHEITMPAGHTFPPCTENSKNPHAATWVLVRRTHH